MNKLNRLFTYIGLSTFISYWLCAVFISVWISIHFFKERAQDIWGAVTPLDWLYPFVAAMAMFAIIFTILVFIVGSFLVMVEQIQAKDKKGV